MTRPPWDEAMDELARAAGALASLARDDDQDQAAAWLDGFNTAAWMAVRRYRNESATPPKETEE